MARIFGVMGRCAVEDVCNALRMKYQAVDIQEIWRSNASEQQKEKNYREILKRCDCLVNIHTGRFFWAKASYAVLVGIPVITWWCGEDAEKIFDGTNGYLGAADITAHFSINGEIQRRLVGKGIESIVYSLPDADMQKNVKWLEGFADIIKELL